MGGFSNDAKHDIVYVVWSFCQGMFGMWLWCYVVYIYRGINYDDMTCWQSSVSRTAITSSQCLIAGNLPQNIPAALLWSWWSSTVFRISSAGGGRRNSGHNLHKISLSGQGGGRAGLHHRNIGYSVTLLLISSTLPHRMVEFRANFLIIQV